MVKKENIIKKDKKEICFVAEVNEAKQILTKIKEIGEAKATVYAFEKFVKPSKSRMITDNFMEDLKVGDKETMVSLKGEGKHMIFNESTNEVILLKDYKKEDAVKTKVVNKDMQMIYNVSGGLKRTKTVPNYMKLKGESTKKFITVNGEKYVKEDTPIEQDKITREKSTNLLKAK